jgi:hypothetical protein
MVSIIEFKILVKISAWLVKKCLRQPLVTIIVVVSRWSCLVGVVSGTVVPREDLNEGNRALLVAQAAAKIREQAKEQVVDDDAVVQ